MKTYRVTARFAYNNVLHNIGDIIELPDEVANTILHSIEPVKNKKNQKVTKSKELKNIKIK